MDKPLFRQLHAPKLENPILIEGLPGFGNVGKIATRLLVEFLDAKLFAEMYSPSFPDFVDVDSQGICNAPHYNFYSSPKDNRGFIVLTGDVQPSIEDVTSYYEICDLILDFVEKQGCKFVVTIGGFPMAQPKNEVYVAATSSKLAAEVMEKGAIIYSKGRIIGATGLLLGLTKSRGMKGICLLGSTKGVAPDNEAGLTVFKFLLKLFSIEKGL